MTSNALRYSTSKVSPLCTPSIDALILRFPPFPYRGSNYLTCPPSTGRSDPHSPPFPRRQIYACRHLHHACMHASKYACKYFACLHDCRFYMQASFHADMKDIFDSLVCRPPLQSSSCVPPPPLRSSTQGIWS
jgi:hypothetical protein